MTTTDFYAIEDLLEPEEIALRDRVRAFCDKEVTPRINDYWERAEFPFELVPKIAELGISGGTIWAAMSADDGHTVADPFRPSGDLVQLLRQRVGSAPRDRLLPARREAHGLRARGARRVAGLLRA